MVLTQNPSKLVFWFRVLVHRTHVGSNLHPPAILHSSAKSGETKDGGERGIRTLDAHCCAYTLSKRAPSTTRTPLQSYYFSRCSLISDCLVFDARTSLNYLFLILERIEDFICISFVFFCLFFSLLRFRCLLRFFFPDCRVVVCSLLIGCFLGSCLFSSTIPGE